MRLCRFGLHAAFLIYTVECAAGPPAATPMERRLDSLRKSPPELYAFLLRMPKGGDLHNHLHGAVYAEDWLKAAAADQLCIDQDNWSLQACSGPMLSASRALADNHLANLMIDSLSMRNFVPGKESGHDHFFAAFDKFRAVGKQHAGEFVAAAARRAAQQNISYLELMALDGGRAAKLGTKLSLAGGLDAALESARHAGIDEAVAQLRAEVDSMEHGRVSLLGCDPNRMPPSSPCNVTIRYIFQVLREFPPEQVFAQIVAGFALADSDPRVVAVNLVQPEDGLLSTRDYHRHMEMLAFARRVFPRVHLTLHAGEVAPPLVAPEELRYRVREAVEIARAERIGHGADVMCETDATALLHTMHARKIPVEISLTSSDAILGVSGNRHPLPVYRRYGVPVLLCTDDEGVSRTHLTEEYQRAVMTYGLRYADLKQVAAAAIDYSFLPQADKQRLARDLQQRFAAFEREELAQPAPQ